MKQLLLRGPPGVGKSTLGKILNERIIDSKFVTSGGLLRAEADRNPHRRTWMGAGELVDSGLIMGLMKKEFENLKMANMKWIILDGFPRKELELDQWMSAMGKPTLTVSLEADRNRIINILSNRRICNACGKSYNTYQDEFLRPLLPKICDKCDSCKNGALIQREDDSIESIRRRLAVHDESEGPIMIKLQECGCEILKFNNTRGIEDYDTIADDIVKLVNYFPSTIG